MVMHLVRQLGIELPVVLVPLVVLLVFLPFPLFLSLQVGFMVLQSFLLLPVLHVFLELDHLLLLLQPLVLLGLVPVGLLAH